MKKKFPIFNNIESLVYLDSASTTQKPLSVINSELDYYSNFNANIKRGIYKIAEESTRLYEESRLHVAKYLSVQSDEIVFTSGATQGVNFIASSWGASNLNSGDEIVVTELEHHSNFVPWQRLAINKNLVLKVAKVKDDGSFDYQDFERCVNNKTKLIAVTCQSNVTGEIIDLMRIKKVADSVGAKLFLDAAQIIGHKKLNLSEIKPDFLVFSAHKMYGPTGVGVLYINKNIQDYVEPYQTGGGMVFSVGLEKSVWQKSPYKFEAGTPPIAQVIALKSAIDFMDILDIAVLKNENALINRIYDSLKCDKNIRIISSRDSHIFTFVHDKVHAHDLAAYFANFNVCVRAGNHCAQPLHNALKINSSLRVSVGAYNDISDVDFFISKYKELSF